MFYSTNASAHVCGTKVFVLCRGEGAPTYRFQTFGHRSPPVAGRHVPRQPHNGETIINDGSVNILFSPAVFFPGGIGPQEALENFKLCQEVVRFNPRTVILIYRCTGRKVISQRHRTHRYSMSSHNGSESCLSLVQST